MNFAYEGFTHNGSKRRFVFRGTRQHSVVGVYALEVELSLFAENKVSVQDGPSFCLQMLTKASSADPEDLDRFASYQVVGEDFRPLVVEREKREAEKALRKRARIPVRKPAPNSALRMDKIAAKV